MAKSSTINGREDTGEIAADQWIPFLAQFTREHRGAHAVLEVFGKDVGDQVVAEGRPFEGISADSKDGESTVWIALGSSQDGSFSHAVPAAAAIRLRPANAGSGPAIEIQARDGTTSLLTLSRSESYELPSANSRT